MADRCVIVDSPEIAARGAELFPKAVVLYANGKLPPEALTYPDAVIISKDLDRITTFGAEFAAAQCKKIRFANADISLFNRSDIENLGKTGQIHEFKTSAPQESSPAAIVPSRCESGKPAGAEPSEEAADRDLSDFDVPAYHDEDDAVETFQRSLRNASALKSAAHHEEWYEPTDFWGVRPILPFEPKWIFPILRPFITNVAGMVGCDPGIPWIQALAFAAGCLNDNIKVRVRPNQDWAESARIWACVVGDSGDGKSPSMKTIMREARDLEFEIARRSKENFAKYKDELDLYEMERKAWLARRMKNDAESPAGERPTAPERPVNELLFFNSTTSEGLLEQQEASTRGTMCEADEFLGWLLGMDQYKAGGKGSDRQFWLSSWDGAPFVGILVGKLRTIPNTGCTIIGGSQPDALRRAATKLNLDSDGLIQRVIVYNSTGLAAEDSEQSADRDAIGQWKRIVSNLYAMKPHLEHCRFDDGGHRIRREAGEWIAHIRSISQFPAAARQSLSKWRAYLPRIALTLHAIECADEGREAISEIIPESTVACAWAYMSECLWPHMLHFYSTINEYGDGDKNVKAFAEYVLARNIRTIKPHQLNSAWSNVKKGMTTVQWRELWAQIEATGWARPAGTVIRSTGLSTDYTVNPLAFDGRFAEPARLAREAVELHRAAQHPAFLARQGRQPGED